MSTSMENERTAPAAPAPPKRIAVLGAGTMGAGIAALAALRGSEVALFDSSDEALRLCMSRIRKGYDGAIERGKTTRVDVEAAIARVRAAGSIAVAVSGASWVLEAVPEAMSLKKEVLREAQAAAPEQARIGTNTSSLSVTELASACDDPARVAGVHFFNPPLAMPLIEIVRGEATSEATIEAARSLGASFGKETIVVRDSPGFATSRLGIALGNEAMRMLESGVASAEDIDRAMELGYRHPMGPLRLSDLVGLDVRLRITEHLYEELGTDTFLPPQILKRLVRAGKLGKKTGEGFYRYD